MRSRPVPLARRVGIEADRPVDRSIHSPAEQIVPAAHRSLAGRAATGANGEWGERRAATGRAANGLAASGDWRGRGRHHVQRQRVVRGAPRATGCFGPRPRQPGVVRHSPRRRTTNVERPPSGRPGAVRWGPGRRGADPSRACGQAVLRASAERDRDGEVSAPSRRTPNVAVWPGVICPSIRSSVWVASSAVPSIEVMMSPALRPAFSAGLPATTTSCGATEPARRCPA